MLSSFAEEVRPMRSYYNYAQWCMRDKQGTAFSSLTENCTPGAI
jgi:hypothetical protein